MAEDSPATPDDDLTEEFEAAEAAPEKPGYKLEFRDVWLKFVDKKKAKKAARHKEANTSYTGESTKDRDSRLGINNVLQGLDFTVNQGDLIVVMGRSGCGKSTLVEMITGTIWQKEGVEASGVIETSGFTGKNAAFNHMDLVSREPMADEVSCTVNETGERVWAAANTPRRPVFGAPKFDLTEWGKEIVTFMRQKAAAGKGNLRQLALYRARIQGRVTHGSEGEALALEKMAAAGGLDKQLKHRLKEEPSLKSSKSSLSGGQEQRLSFANTISGDAEIYVFDEPSSAIDSIAGALLENSILDLHRQNKTVIMVSHSAKQALRMCGDDGRVVMMHEGKILEEGLGKELATNAQHDLTKEFLNNSALDPIEEPYLRDFLEARLDTKNAPRYEAVVNEDGDAEATSIRWDWLRKQGADLIPQWQKAVIDHIEGLNQIDTQADETKSPFQALVEKELTKTVENRRKTGVLDLTDEEANRLIAEQSDYMAAVLVSEIKALSVMVREGQANSVDFVAAAIADNTVDKAYNRISVAAQRIKLSAEIKKLKARSAEIETAKDQANRAKEAAAAEKAMLEQNPDIHLARLKKRLEDYSGPVDHKDDSLEFYWPSAEALKVTTQEAKAILNQRGGEIKRAADYIKARAIGLLDRVTKKADPMGPRNAAQETSLKQDVEALLLQYFTKLDKNDLLKGRYGPQQLVERFETSLLTQLCEELSTLINKLEAEQTPLTDNEIDNLASQALMKLIGNSPWLAKITSEFLTTADETKTLKITDRLGLIIRPKKEKC